MPSRLRPSHRDHWHRARARRLSPARENFRAGQSSRLRATLACVCPQSFDRAFSGAATALMLKRRCPNARVLIIEKTTEFDRKVGESTTEVSSCYMTRILGLTHHLGHHHLPKQGLRLWFSQHPEQSFDDCV